MTKATSQLSTHATAPLDKLGNAFDSLAQDAPRLRNITWLPFAAIALLAMLIAGLFIAIILEDRQLQREAAQRDLDSAAQQLVARLGSLTEALTTTALDIRSGGMGERRFGAMKSDLMVAKPELVRVLRVNARAEPVWAPAPTRLGPTTTTERSDDALLPLLERVQTEGLPVLAASPAAAAAAAQLVLAVPLFADGVFDGALVARLSAPELLRQALGEETRSRYRVSLHAGQLLLGSTSASATPRNATVHSLPLTLQPLQMQRLELTASAFRQPSVLMGDALLWTTLVLALAVAIALVALLRFTTRLVRADRALLAETAMRRAMEDSLATGLRVVDRQGVIRYVNKAFCQMTGWSEADLVGQRSPFPYWPAEHHDAYHATMRDVLAGSVVPAGFEIVVQRPDGSRFDARMYDSALVDAGGRQIGWVSSMADITEPKRVRNELAAAHDRFTRVLESLEAAVSVVALDTQDPKSELLFANREYQRLFGEASDGHRRLAGRLHGAAAELHAGEAQDESSGRWFDVRLRDIRWVDGRPAQLQIASDITLRKETDEIVRQQQDKVQFTSRLMTMGEMASSLAHELNQPLTAINNYSQGVLNRLLKGPLPLDELLPALEKTSNQAQRAGKIIRRIREFVKRSEPRRRATSATRVIEDAIGFAEIEAAKKRVAITAAVDPALPELYADPILIEQVLLNLLKNAVDAMDHALVRRIDVTAGFAAEPGFAEIAVIDRGSGIPEEHLANLFQPFFSTKSEGMGMGLNICRSIVEFHQGRFAVEPNAEPTGGTVMRFTLPLAQDPPQLAGNGAIAENRAPPNDKGQSATKAAQDE
ncbi:MAG: PAS domain S-box protein [Burkholderiales bacterium]|jgi:PAS domain S-box-containing protein|nr:PAS domain S-box protein [Burkholderiales bacterium]